MRRPPPRSTLFPDTTLFRSALVVLADVEGPDGGVLVGLPTLGPVRDGLEALIECQDAREGLLLGVAIEVRVPVEAGRILRSAEHTSELQSRQYLVCRLLLAK